MNNEPGSPPADKSLGTRNYDRREVAIYCEVREGLRPWKRLLIQDLSQEGFRLSWFPHCSVGSNIWIRINGLEPLPATIRWKSDDGVGCQFSRRLHESVLDHLCRGRPG